MSGMIYLFFQIWVWLLLAVFLGMLIHRWFCCGKCEQQESAAIPETNTQPMAVMPTEEKKPAAPVISDDWKPTLFTSPPVPTDDLKRIKGIGAVIQKTLNELGVYQFEQIANWDDNNCAWVDNFLSFPGRIGREDWVEQAKLLARGETTEFAKRVDKGDINYKS